jgi:hypothetical protein
MKKIIFILLFLFLNFSIVAATCDLKLNKNKNIDILLKDRIDDLLSIGKKTEEGNLDFYAVKAGKMKELISPIDEYNLQNSTKNIIYCILSKIKSEKINKKLTIVVYVKNGGIARSEKIASILENEFINNKFVSFTGKGYGEEGGIVDSDNYWYEYIEFVVE